MRIKSGLRRIYNTVSALAGMVPDTDVVCTDNHVEWRLKGKPHRVNAPARISNDGLREWFKDGLRHRTDGPAIERACGCCAWWMKGELYQTMNGAGDLKVYKTFEPFFKQAERLSANTLSVTFAPEQKRTGLGL